MIIINHDTKKYITNDIANVDENLGEITQVNHSIVYRYILERPAEYKEVIIAEYPETGGKDVEYQEVSPEVGHWEMFDTDQEMVLDYPIEIDVTGLPKDQETPNIITIVEYRPYSKQEIAELKAKKEEEERLIQEDIDHYNTLKEIPSRVDEVETTQDDMILLLADIVGGAI